MKKRLLWTSNPDLEAWCQTHPSAGGPYAAKHVYEANNEMLSELQRRCAQFAVPNGILAFGTAMELDEGPKPVAVILPGFDSCLHPTRIGLVELSLFVTEVRDLYIEEVHHGLVDCHLFRAFRFGVSPCQKAALMGGIREGTVCSPEIMDSTYTIGEIFEEIYYEISKNH